MEIFKNNYTSMLFIPSMIEAILEDKKTQTRRILKKQPVKKDGFWNLVGAKWSETINQVTPAAKHSFYGKMPCKPGDVIWVREKYRYYMPEGASDFYYAYEIINDDYPNEQVIGYTPEGNFEKWRPAKQMPRQGCRLFLKVLSVHAELLHEITEEDAIAEGCFEYGPFGEYAGAPHPSAQTGGMLYRAYKEPIRAFQSIWEFISGENSWKENPWVWVIKFEKIERPDDFLE